MVGIIYASVKAGNGASAESLQNAVESFLSSFSPDSPPGVPWSMSYTSRRPASFKHSIFTHDGRVVIVPESPCSIALEDNILDDVRAIWQDVMGDEAEPESFLRFDDRSQDRDTFESPHR